MFLRRIDRKIRRKPRPIVINFVSDFFIVLVQLVYIKYVWLNPDRKRPMSIIRIDDVEYELDLLTEEAKAQLLSLQHTDQKIAELQRDLAIAQTARASYANALRELLGHGADASLQPPTGLQIRH